MAQTMLSVGIDVGTTTSQLIFSRLTIENTAAAFTIPELSITKKEAIYQSEIRFTPLCDENTIDVEVLSQFVRQAYAQANIRPQDVQTGAVIITGETARRENAEAIVHALADLAGSFVVATAGPALESILSARGAGADLLSKRCTEAVVHMDIGGGTANLSCWKDGVCFSTGCYNVGGRLLRIDQNGCIRYRSPVLDQICPFQPGDTVRAQELQPVVSILIKVLEEAVGLQPRSGLSASFITDQHITLPDMPIRLSFSGGIADLIYDTSSPDWRCYGDIGVLLGQAIRTSRLFQLPNQKGMETIRATVMGAGSHTTKLSGSTVFSHNISLPLHNLPVIVLHAAPELEQLPVLLKRFSEPAVGIYLNYPLAYHYDDLRHLASCLAAALKNQKIAVVLLRQDLAKALGFVLAESLEDTPLICLDGLSIPEGSYLDIGKAIEGAFSVIIKTLIFSH